MSNKSELIKKVTISLFAKRGFDGTTVPLIAEKASVGAGTIYRYFNSKEILLNLIMQEEMSKLEHALRNEFPYEKSTRAQFNHLFNKLIQYCQNHFDSIMLISSHSNSMHLEEKTKCDYSDFLNFISQVVEQGRVKGEINENLPNDVIVCIIFGSVVELAKGFNTSSHTFTNELLETLQESLWRAISR